MNVPVLRRHKKSKKRASMGKSGNPYPKTEDEWVVRNLWLRYGTARQLTVLLLGWSVGFHVRGIDFDADGLTDQID